MATQYYAVNGDTISRIIHVCDDLLRVLGLDDLPKGLVGFDFEAGLAQVIMRGEDTKTKFMRIGKLLSKAGYPSEVNTRVGACATMLKNLSKSELKFTKTSEEVIDVYKRGPSSCMKGMKAVAVYASPDVSVAYLEMDNKVVARALVSINPADGLHYDRVYGLEDPLKKALEEAGFTECCLPDFRVLHLRDDGQVVMPYIDGGRSANTPSDGDEYVLIGTDLEHPCDGTDGYLSLKRCDSCYDAIDGDETYCEHTQETWCQSCFDEYHVKLPDGAMVHQDSDAIQKLEDGSWVYESDACEVEYRNEWHLKEKCVYNSYSDEWILKEDLENSDD